MQDAFLYVAMSATAVSYSTIIAKAFNQIKNDNKTKNSRPCSVSQDLNRLSRTSCRSDLSRTSRHL